MPLESNAHTLPENSRSDYPRQQVSATEGEPDRTAFKEADRFRADTYSVLARLFRAAPDKELIDLLAASADHDQSDASLQQAWTELAKASRKSDPAALDDEFHALFIGLGRGEVLPYASWYLSGFLLDKPLARLRADLDALGIERAENVSDSEDHVAAICETMVLLIDTDAGVGYAAQKRFFDRHLQPWFTQFLGDVRAAQSADFYRQVAELGQQFFEFEESWLSLPQ